MVFFFSLDPIGDGGSRTRVQKLKFHIPTGLDNLFFALEKSYKIIKSTIFRNRNIFLKSVLAINTDRIRFMAR